jgi:hypothetical protein
MAGNLNTTSYTSFPLDKKYSVFSCSVHVKLQSFRHTWIIDTGATDHMVCSVSLFTSITALVSHRVKLQMVTLLRLHMLVPFKVLNI